MAESSKHESGLISSLTESRTALFNKVTARLTAAVKDNCMLCVVLWCYVVTTL